MNWNRYVLYRSSPLHIFNVGLDFQRMNEDWRAIIRRARRRVKLTQKALGERVGLSGEAIRGYERGTRSPSRESLHSLIEVLPLAEVEANAVTEQLGFSQRATLFPSDRFPHYFFTIEELQTHVETVTW